ncbi:hypothetical protein BGZ96_007588 [Linnemannia gamsii]|uniref:F-box domain-containing protein n=1 Tax=Linnemannia gamsii TaxID=64522 RepID=A0ABQ7K115_9FUNG|nr:hypothetical protein BGZ96_007588 [Linnemannia gamsii]
MDDVKHTPSSILLPELRPNLAIYLHPHDLLQMTLVSKLWHSAWTPFLYSHISIQAPAQSLAFLTPATKSALLRYRHHVRAFRTRSTREEIIQLFLNTLVLLPKQLRAMVDLGDLPDMRLTELYLTGEKYQKKGNECILKILEACGPTLRRLRLDVTTIANNQHLYLPPLIRIICNTMTQLQHLCLFESLIVQIPPLDMRIFLETCPSSLVTLTLGWFHFPLQSKEKDEKTKDPSAVVGVKPHPNLKVFSLGAGYSRSFTPIDPEVSSAIFVGFLRSCSPDVKVYGLNLSRSWEFIQPGVTEAIANLTGIKPRYFEVPAVQLSPEVDQSMANEISSLWRNHHQADLGSYSTPREVLRSIQIKGCPLTSPTTFNTIIKSSQHGLQNLTIYHGKRITSQDVQTILHHGTALRFFTFIHSLPLLDCRVMLQSTWSCTLLTQLDIQITGIPRPDVLYNWRGDKILSDKAAAAGITTDSRAICSSIDESRRLQRQIYSRLATLVNLESLQLGYSCPEVRRALVTLPNGKRGYFDKGQQLNCLEMSLDSGLDILAGMKSMRVIYVHSMEHRIGIPELKWFERELPNFQALSGIGRQTTRTCLLYGLDDPGLEQCGVGYRWS